MAGNSNRGALICLNPSPAHPSLPQQSVNDDTFKTHTHTQKGDLQKTVLFFNTTSARLEPIQADP